jgi:hypothetical protein
VLGPPQLWSWLWREWCPLPASQAWLAWRALSKTQDPLAAAWRQAFVDFDTPDRVLSRDLVEAFLAKIATPQQLMDLLEGLQAEGTLLKRDAHQVQELVLAHVAKDGTWKHHTVKGAPA